MGIHFLLSVLEPVWLKLVPARLLLCELGCARRQCVLPVTDPHWILHFFVFSPEIPEPQGGV